MAKVIAFEVQVNGVKTAITNEEQLAAAVRETQKAYKAADYGSPQREELKKDLGRLKQLQTQNREELKQSQREYQITEDKGKRSYRALSAELTNLRNKYKDLSGAEREVVGPQLLKRIDSLDKELKDIDASMGQYQRNVGNYSSAFAQLGGIDLTAFASVPGAIIAVGTAAIAGAKAIFEMTEEIRVLRGQIENLTGESGAQLDSFTARIIGIADTFGESQTEILNAANAVSKQLDITFEEALTGIEEGFIAGSNQSGQFIDSLREYPTFFKEAGLSADAFFKVINQQAVQGIFSDKGVDAVKEVTLRLREMTTSTAAALEGLGLGSEDIKKQIETEGIGGAIATVAQRLGELEADSPEVGAALADIFGGPGEDVGVDFLISLQNINEETGSLIDTTSEYQRQQQETLRINQEFASIQNDIARELAGTGVSFGNLGTQIQTKLLEALLAVIKAGATFIEILRQIPKFVDENKEVFVSLTIALATFNGNLIATNAQLLITRARTLAVTAVQRGAAIATGILSAAQQGLNAVMRANPIGLVVSAIALLVAGFSQAYKRSETFKASIDGLGALAKEVFSIIKEAVSAFVEGFQNLKEGNFRAAAKSFADGIIKSNPVGIALTQGNRLGNAFKDGYEKSLADSENATEQTKKYAEETGKVAEETDNATDKTKKSAEEIKRLQEEIKRLNGLLGKNRDATNKAAVATDAFAKDSIAALRAEVAKLKKDLDTIAPEGQEGVLSRLIDAEADVEKAEAATEKLRRTITDTLNKPLPELDLLSTLGGIDAGPVAEDAAAKIIETNRKKNEKLLEQERARAAATAEIQDTIFQSLQSGIAAIGLAGEARTEGEIAALERRYQKEIDLAEGNADKQEQLRSDLDKARARIERQEFERQKRYRIAAALTSLAEGTVNILASPTTIPDPFGTIFKVFRIGVLTATTAAQISAINKQAAARGTLIEKMTGNPKRGFVPTISSILAGGGVVDGVARGATHADPSGGIPVSLNGIPVVIENGEAVDVDEFGAVAVLNKRSTAANRAFLRGISGKQFPGKRALLSAINSQHSYGVKFAEGGLIPDASNFVISGGSSGSSPLGPVTISEESIAVLANETARAVYQGAKEGLVEGAQEGVRFSERQARLNERTGL